MELTNIINTIIASKGYTRYLGVDGNLDINCEYVTQRNGMAHEFLFNDFLCTGDEFDLIYMESEQNKEEALKHLQFWGMIIVKDNSEKGYYKITKYL